MPRRRVASVRLLLGLVALLALLAGSVVTAGPAVAASSGSLRSLVANLPVATENRSGYNRSLFKLWVDADRDGCDTRREVLIAESTTPVSVGSGCSLSGGTWYSYYDEATWTNPADVDIDHLVPLAEVWDSGG